MLITLNELSRMVLLGNCFTKHFLKENFHQLKHSKKSFKEIVFHSVQDLLS